MLTNETLQISEIILLNRIKNIPAVNDGFVTYFYFFFFFERPQYLNALIIINRLIL